jgi:hypothetical protein
MGEFLFRGGSTVILVWQRNSIAYISLLFMHSLREYFRHDVIELMMRRACAYQVSRGGLQRAGGEPSIPFYLINTATNTQPSWLLIGAFNKENECALILGKDELRDNKTYSKSS